MEARDDAWAFHNGGAYVAGNEHPSQARRHTVISPSFQPCSFSAASQRCLENAPIPFVFTKNDRYTGNRSANLEVADLERYIAPAIRKVDNAKKGNEKGTKIGVYF
eukprot:EG_transcript_49649